MDFEPRLQWLAVLLEEDGFSHPHRLVILLVERRPHDFGNLVPETAADQLVGFGLPVHRPADNCFPLLVRVRELPLVVDCEEAGVDAFERFLQLRPLLLEFQDDPLAHDVADQFLLGPALATVLIGLSPVFTTSFRYVLVWGRSQTAATCLAGSGSSSALSMSRQSGSARASNSACVSLASLCATETSRGRGGRGGSADGAVPT